MSGIDVQCTVEDFPRYVRIRRASSSSLLQRKICCGPDLLMFPIGGTAAISQYEMVGLLCLPRWECVRVSSCNYNYSTAFVTVWIGYAPEIDDTALYMAIPFTQETLNLEPTMGPVIFTFLPRYRSRPFDWIY